MRKFAFIFHPHDIKFFADGFNEPEIKRKSPELVKKAMKWFQPFLRAMVTGIESDLTGEEIVGAMILVTLLPEHMKDLNDEFALSRFIEAGKLAERLGALIIGLGAYAALYGRHGVEIAAELKIPVTTGNSYTIAIAPEVILSALTSQGKNPADSTMTILGATGVVGGYCLQALKNKFAKINLLSSNYKRLKDFLNSNTKENTHITAYTLRDKPNYILDSDLVLISSSRHAALINIPNLKKGAIIYDGAYPKSLKDEDCAVRKDVLFIDGGAILPPGNPDFHFSFGFPEGLAFPCMAETMILTFEEIFESYSLGRSIDFKKANNIYLLGKKHGFKLAGLSLRGKVLDVSLP